jgi:probable blue pigment (indigoidine) exporter
MEDVRRWSLVCAVAPVVWGSTYYVTREFLPADSPLWGATLRALPAGLLLLALRRRRPRGHWWWRSMVLGLLNVGAFFVLVYVAAQALPVSVASTIMATSPLTMMVVAWALVGERPAAVALSGAVVGVGGVWLMLGPAGARPAGVLASVTAMLLSSVGYVLAKRWRGEVDVLASTSWQLVAGGLLLVPVAVGVEGAPPALNAHAVLGFAYVSGVATALAFVAWFAGLAHLRTSTVALIGLLNPVTGVLLGTLVAGEGFTLRQLGGLLLVLAGVAAGQVARPMLTRAGTGPSPQPRVSAPPASEHRSEVRARSAARAARELSGERS